jgi:hypothetical protein
MPPKRDLSIRSVGRWTLILVLAILAVIVLIIAFEFVRLLVDPGARA